MSGFDKRFYKSFLLFLLLFILSIFLIVLFRNVFFVDKEGNIRTSEATYADLPFHLSLITRVPYGKFFPPEHPFYAGKVHLYPFFSDFLSGFLVFLGFSIKDAILVPTVFFSIIFTYFLFVFYYQISEKKFEVAYFATIIFWLYGGLGFYFFFRDVIFKGKFFDFLTKPQNYPDYTHVFSENIHWVNFLTRIVIPERAAIFGLLLGVIILYLLFVKRKREAKDVFFSAFLTGLLPWMHTHTFLTFSFIIPFLSLWEIRLKRQKFLRWFKEWFFFGFLVFAFTLPWFFLFLKNGGRISFLRFHFGWKAEGNFLGFFSFWIKNAGIILPLSFASFFIPCPQKVKKFTVAGFFLFLLINLFLFQPFDWDNIKLIFWIPLFWSLSSSFVLLYIFSKEIFFAKAVAIFLFFGLIISFFPSFYRESKVNFLLFTHEEIELSEWVKKNTKKDAVFLTAPIHNSFVSNLAGRKILMGYPGSLWTQGIEYSERERDLMNFYKGLDLNRVLLKYKMDYIVVNKNDKKLGVDLDTFYESFCLVKESKNYLIFSVSECDKKSE